MLFIVTGTFMCGVNGFAIAIHLNIVILGYFLIRTFLQRAVGWFYMRRVTVAKPTALVILLLGSFVWGFSGVTFELLLRLSRSQLNAYAHHAYTAEPMLAYPSGPRRIGLFYFSDIRVTPSMVTFHLGPASGDQLVIWWSESLVDTQGNPLGSLNVSNPGSWWPLIFWFG